MRRSDPDVTAQAASSKEQRVYTRADHRIADRELAGLYFNRLFALLGTFVFAVLVYWLAFAQFIPWLSGAWARGYVWAAGEPVFMQVFVGLCGFFFGIPLALLGVGLFCAPTWMIFAFWTGGDTRLRYDSMLKALYPDGRPSRAERRAASSAANDSTSSGNV